MIFILPKTVPRTIPFSISRRLLKCSSFIPAKMPFSRLILLRIKLRNNKTGHDGIFLSCLTGSNPTKRFVLSQQNLMALICVFLVPMPQKMWLNAGLSTQSLHNKARNGVLGTCNLHSFSIEVRQTNCSF